MKSLKKILLWALLAVGMSSGEVFASVTFTFRNDHGWAANVTYPNGGTSPSNGGDYIPVGQSRTWTIEQGTVNFRIYGGPTYTYIGDFYFDHIDDGGVYVWTGTEVAHQVPPPLKTTQDIWVVAAICAACALSFCLFQAFRQGVQDGYSR